uniref:Uncharacterized protein n=1 Tax=Kalanchoe fedtschenkoi TaxID=63787 RepID=A0A7N0ZX01_KALFE
MEYFNKNDEGADILSLLQDLQRAAPDPPQGSHQAASRVGLRQMDSASTSTTSSCSSSHLLYLKHSLISSAAIKPWLLVFSFLI